MHTKHSEDPTNTLNDTNLSRMDLHRLTLWKWRYSLETLGFSRPEVEDLAFLTWLYASARVRG